MIRVVGLGVVVWGGVVGLMLTVNGCRSESRQASGVSPEPPAAVVKTPDDTARSQVTPSPGVAAPVPQSQSVQSRPEESNAAVDLRLRLSPGATAAYRVVVEQGKSVTWQGAESTKPRGFEDGHTDNRAEMTFGQEVLGVDAAGDAAVRITIQTLKYFNRVHNKVGLDFDSTRQADQSNPLAKLVGQSYQIKLSHKGDVLEIVDVAQARAAITPDSPAYSTAQRLLSDEGIRERHIIPALAASTEDPVRPGQSWSNEKSFSFSWMGSKSFERVYTLREVSEGDGGRLAVVEMKAIPAAGKPQGPPAMGPLAGAFDNASDYDGRLVFDLAHGQVREHIERMRTEWIVADPQAIQGKSEPAAIKMGANWLRRVELVK